MNLESNENKINKLVEENNLLKKKIEVLEKTQNIIIKTLNIGLYCTKKNCPNLIKYGYQCCEKCYNNQLRNYINRKKKRKNDRLNTDNGSNSIKKKQKINSEGSSIDKTNKKKSVKEVYSSLYKNTIDSFIRTNWSKIKLNNIIKFRMKDIKGKESVNNLINKLGEKVEQIMKKLWIQNASKFKEILFSKKKLGEYIQHLLEPKAQLIVKSMKELIKKFNEYNKNSGSFVTYVTCKSMELLLSSKIIPIVKNRGMCGEDGIYGLKPPYNLKGKKEYQNGVWYFPRSCFKLISII